MDPVEIRRRVSDALNAMDYPATKEQLVAFISDSGDTDAVRAVRGLPLAEYANEDEVLRSLHTPGDSAEPGRP